MVALVIANVLRQTYLGHELEAGFENFLSDFPLGVEEVGDVYVLLDLSADPKSEASE